MKALLDPRPVGDRAYIASTVGRMPSSGGAWVHPVSLSHPISNAQQITFFCWVQLSFRYACFGLIGALLAVGPWTIRNAVKEHAFIPFTATAGQQFYTGFNEQAGMNTGTKIVPSAEMMAELRAAETAKAFEAVHWKYARAWVRANPRAAFRLYWLKTLNYFRWDNGSLNTETAQTAAAMVWVQRLTTLGVFGIFLAGGVGCWLRQNAVGSREKYSTLNTQCSKSNTEHGASHIESAGEISRKAAETQRGGKHSIFNTQHPASHIETDLAAADHRIWFWTMTIFLLVTALGHGFFITRYRYRIPFEPMLLAVGVLGVWRKWKGFGIREG